MDIKMEPFLQYLYLDERIQNEEESDSYYVNSK